MMGHIAMTYLLGLLLLETGALTIMKPVHFDLERFAAVATLCITISSVNPRILFASRSQRFYASAVPLANLAYLYLGILTL